jgi:SAM-dependent methyltransferase
MGEAVTQDYPVPPEELRWRAAGVRDVEGFLESGRIAADFLDKEALGAEGRSFADFGTILDFGCGCGRLIRAIRPLCAASVKIHGCDIDRAAIEWCRENMPDAGFVINDEYPPLPFTDQSIDLVLASSVFTHLDAEHQFLWLNELQRIVRPGGYLLATFRYKDVEEIADAAARERIREEVGRDGIAFVAGDLWNGVFPPWYGEAWQSTDYVRRNWGSCFEVCHIIPAGTLAQGTAVLRARESTFLQRLFKRP